MSSLNWTGQIRRRWWGRMEAERFVSGLDDEGKVIAVPVWTKIDEQELGLILATSQRYERLLKEYSSKYKDLDREVQTLREKHMNLKRRIQVETEQ